MNTLKNRMLGLMSLLLLTGFAVSCGDDDEDAPPPVLEPEVVISSEALDFGEIDAETTSTKSFTITVKDLTDDVTVSSTGDAFSISDAEDGTFGASLTFRADDINTTVATVHVKFEPSGDGTFEGTITIGSELADKTVSLTGSVAKVITPAVLQWTEDFDYQFDLPLVAKGNNRDEALLISSDDWVDVKKTGTGGALADGLTFLNYIGSGVGKSVALGVTNNNYARSLKTIAKDPGDVVYVSFLLNPTAAIGGNGANPLTLGTWSNGGGLLFHHRVILRDVSGEMKIGVVDSGGNGAPHVTMSDKVISAGTTYLIVLKKEFIDGPSNDKTSLFILDAVSETEPATPEVFSTGAGTEQPAENVIIPYTNGQTGSIDGIRVANTWEDLFKE